MGEVWSALDTSAAGKRIVALKTTKQEGQEAAKVLFDEARIASLIEHPNVCRVYELGRATGVQYMVMDWCDGASLFDLLQAQPTRAISLGIAARIVAQVALGLHAAHELVDEAGHSMHVVHRDVSPQNVLISTLGHVTISDFGVAKARGQVHQATATGEVKGKLSYMAPEQVRSKDIDRRADIFALGCVLYMATLGKRPFAGADAIALMYKILEANIEHPRQVDPSFPVGLEKILLRSLAKDPSERFETALDFHNGLEEWLREEDRRVTNKDIALLLEHSLGSKINSRNAKIRAMSREPAADEDVKTIPDGLMVATGSVATGTVTTSILESGSPPRPSRAPWLWSLAAVAALGGALSVELGPWAPKGAVVSAQSVVLPNAAATAPPAPSLPPEVRLHITTKPLEARILLDGVEIGRGQVEQSLEQSHQEHRLRVEADGFLSLEQVLRYERDQELTLSLERAPQISAPKVKSSSKVAHPAAVVVSPAPNFAKPPEKRPRAIDTSNPFAEAP